MVKLVIEGGIYQGFVIMSLFSTSMEKLELHISEMYKWFLANGHMKLKNNFGVDFGFK